MRITMKKPILTVAIIAALTILAFIARAAVPSDRPPGVADQDWVKVNDRLGFVIVHRQTPPHLRPDVTGLYLRPPTEGYFMLKGSAGWSRIVVIEPVKGPSAAG